MRHQDYSPWLNTLEALRKRDGRLAPVFKSRGDGLFLDFFIRAGMYGVWYVMDIAESDSERLRFVFGMACGGWSAALSRYLDQMHDLEWKNSAPLNLLYYACWSGCGATLNVVRHHPFVTERLTPARISIRISGVTQLKGLPEGMWDHAAADFGKDWQSLAEAAAVGGDEGHVKELFSSEKARPTRRLIWKASQSRAIPVMQLVKAEAKKKEQNLKLAWSAFLGTDSGEPVSKEAVLSFCEMVGAPPTLAELDYANGEEVALLRAVGMLEGLSSDALIDLAGRMERKGYLRLARELREEAKER